MTVDIIKPRKIDTSKYLTTHDTSMRLFGTYIKYKNKPVYVDGVDASKNTESGIALLCIGREESFLVDPNDEDLDVSCSKIGFLNSIEHLTCGYYQKLPLRRQKQGLCYDYLQCFRIGSGINSSLFSRKNVFDLQEGIYPSFKEVIEYMSSGRKVKKGLAISRNLAISSHESTHPGVLKLYFRTSVCGVILSKEKEYKLFDNIGRITTRAFQKHLDSSGYTNVKQK